MSHELAALRRTELESLFAGTGGTVTPSEVVAFASDPRTALHSLFEWDDDAAARAFREVQAQGYLRAVVRIIPRDDGAPVTVRAFVSLSSDRGSGVYRSIVDVLDDDEQRAELVQDARRELGALKRKHGHLEELAQVWDAIAGMRPMDLVA